MGLSLEVSEVCGIVEDSMKPTKETITALIQGIDERLVDEHLSRMDDDYFNAYTIDPIAAHIRALSQVTPKSPDSN